MRRGQSFLNDSRVTQAWVVTLPERLPVSEALELLEGLGRTQIPVGGAIMNRVMEDPFDDDERAALQAYLSSHNLMGEVAFGRLHKSKEEIERLESHANRPVITLPEVSGEPDLDLCHSLAQALLLGDHAP
jgi:anion-transporting  ArsA/GET3 family ATPase